MSAELTFSNLPDSPDWSEPQGFTGDTFADGTVVDDSLPVTFVALNVVTPTSPQGIIIESGAKGDGMALSFAPNGDLVGAAGRGDTTTTDNRTVFVTLDGTNLASKSLDIYWCISPQAPGRAKLYVYDNNTRALLGMAYADIPDGSQMGSQDPEGDWTGLNAVGVGVPNNVRAGVDTSSFNGILTNGVSAYTNYLPDDFSLNTYSAATFNAAYYGQAVYGVARYGQFIVSNLPQAVGTGQVSGVTVNTAVGVTDVSATGFIRPVGVGQFEIDIYEVLESTSATGATNSVIPHADSKIVANSVSATGQANGVVTAVSELLNSVSATGQVTATDVGASESTTGVSSAGSANTVTVNLTELLNSVSSAGTANTVTASSPATVSVTGVQGVTNTPDAQVNTTEILTGVSANLALNGSGIDVRSVNRVPVVGVQGTLQNPAVQPNITEIISAGVSAQGFTNTVTVPVVQPIVTPAITGTIAPLSVNQFEVDISEVIPTGVSATTLVNTTQQNIAEKLIGVSTTTSTTSLAVTVFEVDVSEQLDSVSATGQVTAAQPNVTEKLGSVSATTAVNGVAVPVVQPISTPAIVSTVEGLFAGEGTFEVDVFEALGSVSATGFVSAQPNVTEKITGVAATGGVGTFTISNNVTLGSTVTTFEAPRLQPNVSEALGSVSAQTFNGVTVANINEPLGGVSATGSADTATVNVATVPVGVVGTFVVGTIEAQPLEALLSVQATGKVNSAQANITEKPSAPAIAGSVNNVTVDAVQFDFNAVKDLYDRQRTIVLPRVA